MLARPAYESLFGLVLLGLLLVSTLDEGAAPVARGLALAGFAILMVLNVGAALGVYVGAALLFSVHHFEGQGSWVDRPDNYALLLLIAYLILGRCFSRSAGRFGRTAVAITLLLGTTLVHLVSLVGVDGYWLAWFARMFGIPLVLFVLLRRAALTTRELRALFLLVAVLGVYLAVLTLLEAADWYSLIIPPWLGDPTFNPGMGAARVGGLAMQPEWNSLEISLAFCVLLLSLDTNGGRARIRVGRFIGSGVCLLAVYFSYTRAAWLALLVAGVPLFWQRSAQRGVTLRRRVLFVSGVLVFASIALFFPSQILESRLSDTGNVYFRFSLWGAGWGMLVDNPLFGVGFGQFRMHLSAFMQDFYWVPSINTPEGGTVAHNTFLSVAAELGLVGLALYVIVLGGTFRTAFEAAGALWNKTGQAWIAGFAIIYLVNVQFITAHELIPNVLYFGFLGALAGAAKRVSSTPVSALYSGFPRQGRPTYRPPELSRGRS